MGEERLKKSLKTDLEHIAGSLLHGEFEVCTCDMCLFLRKKIETIRAHQRELKQTARSLVSADGKGLLSARQLQVALFVAEGLSNREIAAQMGLTEHTVKNYIFHIFNKLGISNRVELVLYAQRKLMK